MDYLQITNSYYSEWVGKENILNTDFRGIQFVYTKERNRPLPGYSKAFDLYVFCQSDRIVFSYGDILSGRVEILKNKISTVITAGELKKILAQILEKPMNHSYKYVFSGLSETNFVSELLSEARYEDYLKFFKKNNPGCRDTGWVYEYFMDMVGRKLCFGYFSNGELVSCCDTPNVPYMPDKIVEIGINTLMEHRGKGYATDVCIACINRILADHKCPLWSTDFDNAASQQLAHKAGFTKLADVLWC